MENWKTISRFTYPLEAHIAKGYLESEGIETNLKDEMTVQVYSFYSNAIGGVKLLVMESEFEKAHNLLVKVGYIHSETDSLQSKIEIVSLDLLADKNCCPFCRSENISKKRKPNMLTVALMLFVNLALPIFSSTYKCFDCEKEWRYRKNK